MIPLAILSLILPAGPRTEEPGRRPFVPPPAVVACTCPDCGRPMGRAVNLRTGESWPACSWCPVPRWR